MKTYKLKTLMKDDKFVTYSMTDVIKIEIPMLYSKNLTIEDIIYNAEFKARMQFIAKDVIEKLSKCKLVEVELKVVNNDK
jgi:hypothetical protein